MPTRLRRAYDQRLREGTIKADPGQLAAVEALSRLERDLSKKGLFGGVPDVQGVYLWGPPGRGKSMVMDLFFACSPEPRKLRAHFHAFMARVHGLIRQWREGDAKARKAVFGTHKGDDPIAPVAALIAREARLLCFDELQVTDIGDALILGRLFEALFAHKVVLAVTSNREPGELYKNGVNRELFVPFIDIIRRRCEVIQTAGAHDWRLDRIRAAKVWFAPDDAGCRAAFDRLWRDLKGDAMEAPAHLTVMGRDLELDRAVGGMARATFAELCAKPLGPQDYLAVAERFHTLFLEDIPALGSDRHIEARRFVTLIDALYEAKTRLVALAETPPEALYTAGIGAFEFERTVSRLNEMSSEDWLAKPHGED
ncbi:MAG: cell division protein ZapE [Brevundimonas sp.]|nr:MAG: cell division protein ZapE [Brevundimonas sp.]